MTIGLTLEQLHGAQRVMEFEVVMERLKNEHVEDAAPKALLSEWAGGESVAVQIALSWGRVSRVYVLDEEGGIETGGEPWNPHDDLHGLDPEARSTVISALENI